MISAMVFTIVFGIHCNFCIILPIYLFLYLMIFLQGKTCTPEKTGASHRFRLNLH